MEGRVGRSHCTFGFRIICFMLCGNHGRGVGKEKEIKFRESMQGLSHSKIFASAT